MKKLNILILSAAALVMSSCSSSFLDRDPLGNTILQNQYEVLDNTVEGSVRGIYSLLYMYSDHDSFGKRSIDMYTDLLSGDMALTSYSYGWFYSDEQGMTSTNRTSYVWSHYYLMMRNVNKAIALIKVKSEMPKKMVEFGLPEAGSLDVKSESGEVLCTYTEEEATIAGYYAQLLAIRGYIYAHLAELYSPTPDELQTQIDSYPLLPIYTEDNMDEPQPLSMSSEVFKQAHADLESAIEVFEVFDAYITRETKLRIDVNVTRGILAYSYLNSVNTQRIDSEVNQNALKSAVKLTEDIIASNEYQIIQNREMLTTGFNDQSHSSWMWGQDVTVETSTGLGSFFGQVDIHSYSYAWAGDTKVIDEKLYDEYFGKCAWDGRVGWFRDKKDKNFPLCPDGKFFSAKCPKSTDQDDIDREWLSDNVFMRIEAMYLIAAEANCRLGNFDKAVEYLTAITDQRVKLNDAEATAAYAAFKLGLTSKEAILEAIYDNWRIEMWGEGYGLQTFRRFGLKKTRGGNHSSDAGSEVLPSDSKYTFKMPSSESTYNPAITED